MTSFKKILSLLLCLLMCLSLFPTAAFAAEPVTEEAEQSALLDGAAETENSEEPEQAALAEPAEDGTETPSEAEENDPEAPAPVVEEELLAEPAEEAEEEAAPVEESEEELEEAAEDIDEATEEEETPIYVESPVITYIPEATEDDASLLEEYAYQQLYSLRPQGLSFKAVHDSGLKLEGVNRIVFYNLKEQIRSVAAGESTTTKMEVPLEALGLGKTSWTAEDLGLDKLWVEDEQGEKTFSKEAQNAVKALIGFELQPVITALLSDCPFELYWYNKTQGTALHYLDFTGSTLMIKVEGSLTFYFNVSTAYNDGVKVEVGTDDNGNKIYAYTGINPATGTAVSNAVQNARNIVDTYAGGSDYDKLLGFKDAICEMVSYNQEAADAPSTEYGDPWQIIYVFDGDDTTNVVCEGYAKAFQYLCDIGNLSGKMMTYAVSGTMDGGTGAGAHMWNIVRMENGKNYIVDVTNCDPPAVGADNKLFLTGISSGSVAGGYTVVLDNSASITYTYEEKVLGNFSEAELTISEHSYLNDIVPKTDDDGAIIVWNQEQLETALGEVSVNGGKIRYPGDGDFYIDKKIEIPSDVLFELPQGTLYVKSGTTLTAKYGGIETKHARIDGTLEILGGMLTMLETDSELQVNGTLDNRGTVYNYNPSFVRTEKMLASSTARYVVNHKNIASYADLASACSYASATINDSAVSHMLELGGYVTVTSSLTIPSNVSLRVVKGTGFTINKGVILTNNGNISVYKSLNLPGVLINNGDIKLGSNISVTFGDYAGTGTLGVYKVAGSDPWSKLNGVSKDLFSPVEGYDSKFDGFKLLDSAGTNPMIVTAQTASLNLDGTIGVNFEMDLSSSMFTNPNARAVFIYKGVETSVDFHNMTKNSDGYYFFTYRIPAREFANTISLKFVDGDTIIPMVYPSGKAVAGNVLSYSAETYTHSSYLKPKGRALAQAVQNYCAYAYQYLPKADNQEPQVFDTPDVSTVTASMLDPYKLNLSGQVTGLTITSYYLSLLSSTNVNLELSLAEGHTIGEYTFTLDGNSITPSLTDGSYVLVISNISARGLDTPHELVITHGTESYSVTIFGLSFARTVLNSSRYDSNTELRNLCKAIYLYNAAANAYFGD